MKLQQAQKIAERIIAEILPYCKRAVVGGSTRRLKPDVGDIEIVAEPLFTMQANLFGEPVSVVNTLIQYMDSDQFTLRPYFRNGKDRQRKYDLPAPDNIMVEFYMVHPPAQWGVILAIRTGDYQFNKNLVKQRHYGGYLPSYAWFEDGAVHTKHGTIPMPEEEDLFKFCGFPGVVPPPERTAAIPIPSISTRLYDEQR